ncbi:MAG: cell division protein ZipA [Halieaceae bacterium]
MMEQLSIRDWMVILGGVMIAAVLVDAGRRLWRERRAEIRLNARIDRSKSGSNDDDTFNLLTELPNGGARIVRRDDLEAGDLDAGNLEPASIAEAPATPADAVEERVRKFPAAPDPIDVAVESDDLDEVSSQVEASAEANEPAPAMSASPRRRRTVKPPGDPSTAEARDVSAEGTVDWLDTLEPEAVSETDSVEQGRLPRGANTHVFILYVVARSEEGFAGMDILESLLACDLRFGDMDFFHRHELASGRGPIEFSVANMMKPGVFDIDNMEPLQTRGLMFFVTLPGPTDMLKAFDYMYETAKVVAKALDGDIQDEKRSVVTRQSLEHMRQQIRELERRLLVRRT